jgi:7-cyano-7-deazaguanine reductase
MDDKSPLGSRVPCPDRYAPELLYGISRTDSRALLGLGAGLPFSGVDILNAWELTWLDAAGKPKTAAAEIRIPCDSPRLIESKSLKLYLNSFAMTRLASADDLVAAIALDLGSTAQAGVDVVLHPAEASGAMTIAPLPGHCLDELATACETTRVDAAQLQRDAARVVSEQLHTHLLRSLCPVTGQPDTGSVLITYTGPKIDRKSLLRYIVSFRNHPDFHEACVERMFVDILRRCQPQGLTVLARYLRRGGIDINPFRSGFETDAPNLRLWRQ